MAKRDYYEVLGLERNASADQIKSAYRKLALKYHPDVCDDPASIDLFMKIKEAYDVLRNDRDRKSYDRSRGKG